MFKPKSKSSKMLLLFFVLLVGGFLRFFNFSNRLSLSIDQARDVLLVQAAVFENKIPLVGCFASAGAFVFGPQFYWFLMLAMKVLFFTPFSPWIAMGIVSIMFILVMFFIGLHTENWFLGIVLAFLASFAPAQIEISLNPTHHILAGFFSALCLLFFVLYLKKQRKIFLFSWGISLGISLGLHYQTLMLIFLPIIVFINTAIFSLLRKKKFSWRRVLRWIYFVLGFLITFSPLIIFDLLTNFRNISSLLDYLLIGQYRIYVPNRWLTYVFSFWPQLWGLVISGQPIIIYLTVFITLGGLLFYFVNKEIPKSVYYLGISFLIQFITLRYYRAERLFAYYIFLHPIIIFFAGWVFWKILNNKNKFLRIGMASVIFFIFLTSSVSFFTTEIKRSNILPSLQKAKASLITKFPNDKFNFYNHSDSFIAASYAMSYFTNFDGKVSSDGLDLGVCTSDCPEGEVIVETYDFRIIKFEGVLDNWFSVDPKVVYSSMEEWWK